MSVVTMLWWIPRLIACFHLCFWRCVGRGCGVAPESFIGGGCNGALPFTAAAAWWRNIVVWYVMKVTWCNKLAQSSQAGTSGKWLLTMSNLRIRFGHVVTDFQAGVIQQYKIYELRNLMCPLTSWQNHVGTLWIGRLEGLQSI